eukprot:7285262-Prymnesium_polylepis.1
MDTPYGRFAVTIPPGAQECEPLLVPVPVLAPAVESHHAPHDGQQLGGAGLGLAAGDGTPRDAKEREMEQQLRTLMELGFHAQARRALVR